TVASLMGIFQGRFETDTRVNPALYRRHDPPPTPAGTRCLVNDRMDHPAILRALSLSGPPQPLRHATLRLSAAECRSHSGPPGIESSINRSYLYGHDARVQGI